MCDCRFINCNKTTILEWNVGNKGGYACVKAGGIWKTPVLFSQFCCELKSATKIKKQKQNQKNPTKLKTNQKKTIGEKKDCSYTL